MEGQTADMLKLFKDYEPVSFKLTVTVTEMSNNWIILNQLTVTVTEIKLVTEM